MFTHRECVLVAVVAVLVVVWALTTVYRNYPPGTVMPEYYLHK